MTIFPDDRQGVLEMLDQRPPDENDGDEPIQRMLRDIAAIVPDASMDDIHGVLEDHEERLRDRAARTNREADQMMFIQTVAHHDPDLANDEPMFDAIRHLASCGDEDAMRILAAFESPLSRAVGHITTAALDGASDWVKDQVINTPGFIKALNAVAKLVARRPGTIPGPAVVGIIEKAMADAQ